MRTLLALEGHNQTSNLVKLSLEEEAVVIAETVADEAAITAELTEVARASDISESLEDLAVIADNIETATPIEGALFDQAANMAVAGTDVEPTKLIPASESFKGRSLAAESRSLKDRARDIWQQIKEALKRIWARIESFFYKYFGTLPGLKRDIEKARTKVNAAGGMTIDTKKFTLSSGLKTLTVDGSVLKNGNDIVSALKAFKPVVDDVFANNGETKEFGEAISDAIGSFDPVKPNEQVEILITKISKALNSSSSVYKSNSSIAERYVGYGITASAPFFGNTSVIIKEPKEVRATGTGAVTFLNYLAKCGSFNVQTTSKIPNTPESVEFDTLPISVMDEILDHCSTMVSTVESYQRGKNLKDAEAFKVKLNSASEKATAAIARLETSDDVNDRSAVAAYRALVNMNTFYCNVLANPSVALAVNVQNTVRTMLSLIAKSLAQYK